MPSTTEKKELDAERARGAGATDAERVSPRRESGEAILGM
jgi:hypothetical protein